MKTFNPNPVLAKLTLALTLLVMLAVYSYWVSGSDINPDFLNRHQAPSLENWFGTDNLGRSLWVRCFQGIGTSLVIGVSAAVCSGVLALFFAFCSLPGKALDTVVRTVIDTLLALPHLLLLVLVSFTLGGGKEGVILAVALTHWPRLTLILRAEMLRINQADYVMLARRIGNGPFYRWRHHYLPQLLPQWLVGTLLMFPHAVLHSAALSFLGFGLAPHEASLGLLLADALRYLSSGMWWMALFPGLMLVMLVLAFDQFAKALQQFWLRA